MKTRTCLSLVAAFGVIGLASLLAASPAPAQGGDNLTMRQWFEMMDARYAPLENASPDEVRGTGFKPYHRFKHFMQRRLGDQEDLVPGARWEAWEQLRRMEEEHGTGSETWFTLGPTNVTGRCLAIEIHPTDPNTVYTGFAAGGIWKTTDAGATWTPLGDDFPSMAVSAIEIDLNDPDHIWIGTGEGWGNIDAIHGVGAMESFDAGASWSLVPGYAYDMGSGRDVFEIEHNPATGTIMIAADNGLWRSTDGGATFTQIMLGQWRDVELQQGSSTNMFGCFTTGTNPGFYRSFDDGATWTQTTTGVPVTDLGNMRFGLTASNPNLVYWAISGISGSMLGIWKSTDAGATFSQIFSGGHYGTQGWYNLTIDVDPANGNNVFSGGVNYYRSTNGGASFSQYAGGVHVDHHATAWSLSDPTQYWIGSDGGCWRSTNSGATFTSRNSGVTTLQFYAMNQSETLPTRALGGTQDNGTYKYDNSLTWGFQIGGDGFFCEVDRSDANVLYGELYYGDHRRSTNGGASYTSINNGITQDGPWSTPTWMDFSDPDILWTAHNSRMFKTTNRGTNWTQVAGLTFTQGGVSIHQSLNHPEVMGMVTGSRIWLTNDHGATWFSGTGGTSLTDIHIHPDDPNIILVTQGTYSSFTPTVRKSTDQGASWVAIDNGLPDEPANSIEIDPQNPDTYFVGTDLGVYVSFDAGLNWVPFNTGLPHTVMADIRLHDSARILRAATHGRGMWEVDISGLAAVSSVGERPVVQPITLRVMGNPSASVTTLRYGIRSAGRVKLSLFDVNGRLVRELVDRFEQPVLGSVDVNLRELPAGVYFARLEANGATTSQKLIVEK